MISNLNARRTAFQHKMEGVKQYMDFRKIDKELENRFENFLLFGYLIIRLFDFKKF